MIPLHLNKSLFLKLEDSKPGSEKVCVKAVYMCFCMQADMFWGYLMGRHERSREDFEGPTVASCAVGQRLMPKEVS